MLHKVRFSALFLVLSGAVSGCASVPLNKENRFGFVESSDGSVPEDVRRASGSVFRLLVAAPKPIVVEKNDYDKFAASLTHPNSFFDAFLLDHLKKCKESSDTKCTFVYAYFCSAFLAGSSSELYTARHCFDLNLRSVMKEIPREAKTGEARQKWTMQNYSPQFLLFDQFGKPINDEKGQTPAGDFTLLGSPWYFAPYDPVNPQLGYAALFQDFAKIKLFAPLKQKPLEIDRLPPPSAVSDKVWAVGYPTTTKGREKIGTRDSSGDRLFVSSGVRTSCEQVGKRAAPFEDLRTQQMLSKMFQEDTACTNADLTHGMSGGPVLNSSGKVWGIAVIGYADHPTAQPDITDEPAFLSSFSKLSVLP